MRRGRAGVGIANLKTMQKERITKDEILEKMSHILWSHQIIETKLKSDYPGNFEQQFGGVQYVTLRLPDFGVSKHGKADLIKFLEGWGFEAMRCSCYVSMGDAYFIHRNMMIGLNVAYEIEDKFVDDEEEDDDSDIVESFSEQTYITFCPLLKNKDNIAKFIEAFWDFEHLIHVKDDSRDFYMIAQNAQGLYKQRTKFKNIPIKDDRYDLYYGKSFPKDKIFDFVKSDEGNLMIFHGDPGSGKSNLLKNLITESIYDVIYVPPGMVSIISTPQFVPFMLQNKKCILLVEDAEEILSADRNSGTQNLLGITDGFLRDSLKIKVLATMNCDIGKIDQALLRKGRLYHEHHFAALNEQDVRSLVDYLGLNISVNGPMTLAEIFNQEENTTESSFKERAIGFMT